MSFLATQTLALIDPNLIADGAWNEVHDASCADLHRYGKGRGATIFPAASLVDAAWVVAGDFIGEGIMETVDDAIAEIHWMPCVKLPHGE